NIFWFNELQQRSGVYTVSDFMVTKEDLHVVKPTTSVDEGTTSTVGLVSDYDLLAVDSISGTGRIDRSIFPEVDSTWKSLSSPITGYYSKQNIVDFQLWTVMVNWYVNHHHPLSLFTLYFFSVIVIRCFSMLQVGIITRANVVRAALQIKHENNKTAPV
ncbi:hypothetical protein BHM03_00055169, partial [Ensete ventricosum]